MSLDSNFEDDDLDLRELFAAFWSHKILIAFFTGLFIFLAGYYALTTKKIFTATAIFHADLAQNSSSFNIGGELGALASIAGLNTGGQFNAPKILLERAVGREFIIDLKENFSLQNDIYFNTYNPNYKDPLWKATIKNIIGWKKPNLEKDALIEHIIIENYRKNVILELSIAGAIHVSIKHRDPEKAAIYANGIMEALRRLVENENIEAQNRRLNYLSETLADALQDMEIARENLKNYALKNSAMAQENFISDSLKLDQIRMEKRKVSEISNLLSTIEGLMKSGNLDDKSFEALRSNRPLVDDIEFRRILGMSETISAWTWPDVETIEAVSATLRDRIKRLDVDIKNIEENAKIYATSAEDLAKFKRDAKIAEATYKVLIEQVKAQSLAAGFTKDSFKVFEYATTPLVPTSPQRLLVLLLGALLGISIGCGLSLIIVMRRGVYYTRSSLLFDASAELALRSKSIRRLSRKSISDIISFISKSRVVILDEAVLKLANKKVIYVLNSGGRPTASDAARLLATQSAQSGRNVLLCDTTGQLKKEFKDKSEAQGTALSIENLGKNINIMANADEASFFTSTKFNPKIKELTSQFDQIFVCSNNKNAQLGLMALVEFSLSLVVISSLRKTRKLGIKNIKTRQPIDILFYD
ncbi:Wzz/FepE/Etk N-terminal domain-containing protein [Paracoccaceae bacterium]|nr:Wzz/FepE/Etk N-terminal domain-containing protein [Paracoccaceae bacterium]